MRKDRNCGAYASAPMNGPMMMPYPMMGPMPMGMPTPTQTSCSCSCDNNNGELLQIKQQLNSLERRVSMLENKPTPYNHNNYDSNVQMI